MLYPETPEHYEQFGQSFNQEEAAPTQLKKAAQRLFSTPDGAEVLAALRARTVGRSTLPSTTGDGATLALFMALREGENTLFRYLEALSAPNTTNTTEGL